MTIQEIQKEFVEEFELLESWEDRYEYLINLGKNIEPLAEKEKKDENLIKGCQSQVWITTRKEGNSMFIQADSDAILPKGIIAMLTKIYSGQQLQDILNSDTQFIEKIGLNEFLSPTRANGLLAMIEKIKYQAFTYLNAK